MLLSSTTEVLSMTHSPEESVKTLADAGYKAFDLTLCGANSVRRLSDSEDWKEKAVSLRKYADGLGIICNQAHAFFPSSTGDPEKDAEIYQKIVRDMEIASIMGAKIIVVHPKQHLEYAENDEELFQMNMEFYRSLIPYCEKFGIKVGVENMFQWNNKVNGVADSTCSRVKEMCRYIDTLDSEWMVACLDIGHVNLIDTDMFEFMRTLGGERLGCLHVHDNDGKGDNHTLPFTRSIDYNKVMETLAEIGYKGDLTYEADNFLKGFPDDFRPTAAGFMRQVGDYLVDKFNQHKK